MCLEIKGKKCRPKIYKKNDLFPNCTTEKIGKTEIKQPSFKLMTPVNDYLESLL